MAGRVLFGRAVVRGAQKVLRCDKAAPAAEAAANPTMKYVGYAIVQPLPEGGGGSFWNPGKAGCWCLAAPVGGVQARYEIGANG